MAPRRRIRAGVDHALFYPVRCEGFPALRRATLDPAIIVQDRDLNSDIAPTRYAGTKLSRDLRRLQYELRMVPVMLYGLIFRGARFRKVGFE